MDPAPCAIMSGSTTRQATSAVIRFELIIASQSAGPDSVKSMIAKVPATLTRPLIGPSSARAAARKSSKSANLAASAARPQCFTPASASSARSSLSPASWLSATASRAPALPSTRRLHGRSSPPRRTPGPPGHQAALAPPSVSTRPATAGLWGGHRRRSPAFRPFPLRCPSGFRDNSRHRPTKWSSHLIGR